MNAVQSVLCYEQRDLYASVFFIPFMNSQQIICTDILCIIETVLFTSARITAPRLIC